MTTTYRKTATIEATQWFKMGDHPAVVLKSDPNRYADDGIPWCPTMEGGHVVTPGDWIATGIKGEHWPIKADVFAETYTPVDAARPDPQPAAVECSVMKLVINEDRFLAAIDRAGDHEVSVGHPAADTRDADFVAEIAKGPPLGLSFMGWTNAMMLKARAIIGTATPAQSDKIAEAARDKTAAELVIDAYDAANPFRQADMHPAACHCHRCAIDWLRALAGKGE